jgi:VWFA-related protein
LSLEDFSLTEDGRPQEIVQFRAVDVSSSPDHPQQDASERGEPLRSFLLYFDGRNTSPPFTTRARYAAERLLVDVVRDTDFVGISSSASTASCIAGRGDCKEEVRGIARTLRGEYIAPPPIPGGEQQDSEDRYWRQRETIADLAAAIRLMGRHGGRKSLILMSEDVVFDSMMSEFQDLINVARHANVAVYPVDLRGLVGPGFTAAPPPRRPAGFGAGVQPIDVGGLAEDTGGRFIMSNDLHRALADLGEESSVYYLLGYWPPKDRREGFRKIRVKVSNRELKVRARKGYYLRRNPR